MKVKGTRITCAILFSFIFFILYVPLHAQAPFRFDHKTSPKEVQLKNSWIAYKKSNTTNRRNENLYTLPVVFHIIHRNGPENIPDAIVMDAFQRLNDAFANRGIYDQGSGVDTKIQFCMARKDPDGNHTNGITRTYADLPKVNPELHDQLLRSLIQWDPDRFINIWVVADVDFTTEYERCGYPDIEHSGYGGLDEIVAEAGALPRIIVHEMGHFLGLAHTFEGYCTNNDCVSDGDGICDTPPEQTMSITGGCNAPENSCSTDVQSGFTSDQDDLKTNHMDYGNDACQHDFTQGQKEKMRFVIETVYASLTVSDACNNDCSNPAESEFTFPVIPEYSTGTTINFTNTSTNANSYDWSVNNNIVATTTDLSYSFPGQGWYKFGLLAKPSPDEVKCRNNQLNWIRVYCSIKSVVHADKKKAVVGESIHFSSTITQVVSLPSPVRYEWYYNNGILFGNTASVDFSFASPGKKIFYLVTIQGGCRDTSLTDLVDIKPLPDYTLDLEYPVCIANKPKAIRFSVCNKGYFDMPAGIPITFYDKNPQTAVAGMIGSVFYTDKTISMHCCEEFEFTLPAGFTGNYIFGVINDDHSISTPYSLATDFPITQFPESIYTNNLDSILLEPFAVLINPREATTIIGSAVELAASANQPATYTWTSSGGTFACGDCVSTSFVPTRYTRVVLKGKSEGGCEDSDTIIVKILADGEIFIPTAFTPNNDDLNDYFYVLGGESVTTINSFQVFNRWGELVFERKDIQPNIPKLGWDGRLKGQPSSTGVFVYLITVEFSDGRKKTYKGTVTLIR